MEDESKVKYFLVRFIFKIQIRDKIDAFGGILPIEYNEKPSVLEVKLLISDDCGASIDDITIISITEVSNEDFNKFLSKTTT